MKQFLANLFGTRRAPRPASRVAARRPQRNLMAVEQLPDRIVPALSVTFVGGVLTVSGDATGVAHDVITLTTAADGGIRVAGQFYGATVANTSQIHVNGLSGGDYIDLTGLSGYTGSTSLNGGGGNDTIFGSEGADTLYGADGDDTLAGKGGNDSLNGGYGNDYLYGCYGNDTLYGGEGTGSDVLDGGYGNDTLRASVGNDTYYGGSGSGDTLEAIVLSDSTFYVSGSNSGALNGQVFSGVENLTGGYGRDVFSFEPVGSLTGSINGGGGNDFLSFVNYLAGHDHYHFPDPDGVSVDLRTGAVGRLGGGALVGGGVSQVENVLGSAGRDVLVGNDANNVLVGFLGDDTLSGHGGRDVLIGGDGEDILVGGSGEDVLIGARTFYDHNVTALANLQYRWGRPEIALARLFDIQTSSTPLTPAQLIDDGDSDILLGDTLSGDTDYDWIIAQGDVWAQ